MFYYQDYYLAVILPCLLLTIFAQMNVSSTFSKYSRVRNYRNMTGAQAAEAVLRANGVMDVRIERVAGNLTDHYDPRSNVIRLSEGVYDAATVSAVGVAAHEAGHAVQYAVGYGPIKLRTAIIPVCNVGTRLSFILLVIGLALYSEPLFALGIVFFSLAVVFQLVTLPVEFNASHRALETIEARGLLSEDELSGAGRVLRAAALTYVAALLMSIVQLLRYVLIFLGRRGRS